LFHGAEMFAAGRAAPSEPLSHSGLANAQVLSNHLPQFFLAEHFAHLITTVLRNTHPFAEL
jgi:hypothetical protein